MRKILTFLTASGMVWGLSVSAYATLIDRGGGLIYDDDLNITWLQDANYARTSGYDADGRMYWQDAMNWSSNLVYYDSVRDTYWSDWRLPSAYNLDGTGPCTGYDCNNSEMGHLFYIELGNTRYVSGCSPTIDCGQMNQGPFINYFNNSGYWTSTEYAGDLTRAWWFSHSSGGAGHGTKTVFDFYAWAVRDGDVVPLSAPVPEPSTLFLLGSGLAGLGGAAAWRRHGSQASPRGKS